MIVFPIGNYLLNARQNLLIHYETKKHIDLSDAGLLYFYLNLDVSYEFKEGWLFDVFLDRDGSFIRLGHGSARSRIDDIVFR